MIIKDELKPGKLIKARGREWVVLPSDDKQILNIKPLGGSVQESTSIFLPFDFANEKIEEVYFPLPSKDLIGDFTSANLLYNAIRLSFREASGPFRCLGKLNFTPRAYQMIPLIMALKQVGPVRLFIADDVGIGKTVESLMIVRELLDRGMIKKFAVICLPHLCDQWASEINQKFGLEAVVFTSGNAAKLRRQVPINQNPLEYYPYQVVSIDYMKSVQNTTHFVSGCPEMVIVDEIHTCADDGTGKKQMRHNLISKISDKPKQNLILLSATPHSGKPDQFKSILGLIDPKFKALDLGNSTQEQRKELALHYVQRRRADIIKWTGNHVKQETSFPERDSIEVEYELSPEYLNIQSEIMQLARQIVVGDKQNKNSKLPFWTALGLVRGVMSSPSAGLSMLDKRAEKISEIEEVFIDTVDIENDAEIHNPVLEDDFNMLADTAYNYLISKETINDGQWTKLKDIAKKLVIIDEQNKDTKVNVLIKLISDWLKQGFHPIIYCRYINTAEYLYKKLKIEFNNKVYVTLITSLDPDEVRRDKVSNLKEHDKRILVATDCMSEGINLQESFNAIIHYDLPWNPNRLEQREGRVDRFGQSSSTVKTALIYAKNNPMDGIVFKVLLQKAREIKKSIGISVPFPENNQSIMETVTKAILFKEEKPSDATQLSLFSDDELTVANTNIDAAYKKIADIENVSRSIFAQHSIKANDIDKDLDEAIRLIGDIDSVESFVVGAIRQLGGDIKVIDGGYMLYRTGLPMALQSLLSSEKLLISFTTPPLPGFMYMARNHPITEQLCQVLIDMTLNQDDVNIKKVARCSVIKTSAVKETTTILFLRARNVIESLATKHQIVAEELMLWGYIGEPKENNWLDEEQCLVLLKSTPEEEVAKAVKRQMIEIALEDVSENKELINTIARARAEHLVEAHDRFRVAVKGKTYQVVEPVLPMDVMGIYVLMSKKWIVHD
jgi:superfamily II DNA or RNA helicase